MKNIRKYRLTVTDDRIAYMHSIDDSDTICNDKTEFVKASDYQQLLEIKHPTSNIPCKLDVLIEQLAEAFEDTNSNQNDWIRSIRNVVREWKKLKEIG